MLLYFAFASIVFNKCLSLGCDIGNIMQKILHGGGFVICRNEAISMCRKLRMAKKGDQDVA